MLTVVEIDSDINSRDPRLEHHQKPVQTLPEFVAQLAA
jgi:hypothetical protein